MRLRGLFILMLALHYSFLAMGQASGYYEPEAQSLRQQLCIPPNDSLLHLDHITRSKRLWKFYKTSMTNLNNDSVEVILKSIKSFAKTKGDENLLLELQLMRSRYNSLTTDQLIALDSIAQQKDLAWFRVRTKQLLGMHLFRKGNKGEGLYHLFGALSIMKRQGVDMPMAYKTYSEIAQFAYKNQEFESAKLYWKRALNIHPEPASSSAYGMVNSLGLCYRGLNMLDSSDHYFQLAKESALAKKDTVWSTVIDGNLGENLYRKGLYQKALPLLQADADYCLSINSNGNASNALILLSDAHLQLGNVQVAQAIMQQAIKSARKANDLRRMAPVYHQLSKWYAVQNDGHLTLAYADSAAYVYRKLQQNFSSVTAFEAEKVVAMAAEEVAVENAKAIADLAKLRLWSAVGISGLLIAFFVAYFFSYRNRNRLKQAELQLSNARLEEELVSASAELQAYIDNIRQTNEAADELVEKVILTDSHWREFLSKFNQAHPQFLDKLLTLNASLTKAERRLCCLTYLSLSDKEMAAMLGVGTNSIRVTRNRVRKKLQIGLEQDLEQLLQAL